MEHLNEHNITNDSQHGFTKGCSYLANPLEFFKKIKGKPVVTIYLNFAKAFSKVPIARVAKSGKQVGLEDRY